MLLVELLECLPWNRTHSFILLFLKKINLLCFLLCAMQYVLGTTYMVVNKTDMFPSLMELEEDRQ